MCVCLWLSDDIGSAGWDVDNRTHYTGGITALVVMYLLYSIVSEGELHVYNNYSDQIFICILLYMNTVFCSFKPYV